MARAPRLKLQAGEIREHTGHYKRGYSTVRLRSVDLFAPEVAGKVSYSGEGVTLDGSAILKAQVNTINRGLTRGRQLFLGYLTGRYNRPRKYFSRWFKGLRADARKGSFKAILKVGGPKAVPIEDWPHQWRGRQPGLPRGVRDPNSGLFVQVLREGGVAREPAFPWDPHGWTLYFSRVGKDRLPIKRQFRTSGLERLANELESEGSEARRMDSDLSAFMLADLERQIEGQLLKKSQPRKARKRR